MEDKKEALSKLWHIGEKIRHGNNLNKKERKNTANDIFKLHDEFAELLGFQKIKVI